MEIVPAYVEIGETGLDVSGLLFDGSYCSLEDAIYQWNESRTTIGSSDACVCGTRRRRATENDLKRIGLAPTVPLRKQSLCSPDEPLPGFPGCQDTNHDNKKSKPLPESLVPGYHRKLSTATEKSIEDSVPAMPQRRESIYTISTGRPSWSSKSPRVAHLISSALAVAT